MFRRSRFSVRPNVGGPGRTAAPPQEAAPVGQEEAPRSPKDISNGVSISVAGTAPAASGDGNDPSGEGCSSSAAVQRRKRFSIKPKVAPGRPATLPRVPKSPAKVVSESPAKVSELESTTSNEVHTPAATQSLQCPSPQKPSADSKLPCVQSTSVSCDGSGDTLKESHSLPRGGKKPEKTSDCFIKVPPRPLDKVSLPDRESAELSEKAKTLLSSKGRSSIPKFSLSRLLNDPSDVQRLEKAQKLRDLLKQEMRKEKARRRSKKHLKEFSVDPTKMTMRDLIRYLPLSNPMSSSIEDGNQENETVIPFSPRLEIPPERTQKPEPEVVPKTGKQTEEEEEEGEEAGQEEEEEEDEALMVPQVKVAEDGTLILDEESLTVEVQRTKGANPVEDRDPIFERGSTTMYSSFRASTYCKPWSSEETDMFFLAISMVGTDFSMICQLFPNRTRSEIRNKFKKEERLNSWRVDKAFEERRKLDIEYFSKLLQKVLELQESRKKLKLLVEKNAPRKRQRKSKGTKRKKAASELSGSEDEEDLEEDVLSSSEAEDREKENEELCKEGGALVSKAKRKRKRRSEEDVSAPKLMKGKRKTHNEEDEACIPKDTEAALPEDHPNSEVCESAEMEKTSKGASVQAARLSRGRATKPAVPLGPKRSKKLSSPPSADQGGDGASAEQDNTSKEQANTGTSPSRETSDADIDDSSGDEDYPIKPAKATRYGRVPKPTALLNYSAKEDSPTTQPELQPKRSRTAKASPATPAAKKPKLGMPRASGSEPSKGKDDDTEERGSSSGGAREECSTPVPASPRSSHAAILQEEEEIADELDIFADMSVLDMSQDALCLNSSCERAQIETGSREPCVHQLDLLVDVIDFLSSEHTEVSEAQSYNEAAQTLLTIGHVSQLPTQDQNTGIPLDVGNETCLRLEEEIVAELMEENNSRPVLPVSAGIYNTESSPQIGEGMGEEQRPASDPDSTLPSQSSPHTRKAHSSEVKPKPDLARASREPETSAAEIHSAAPDLSKETTPNMADYSQPSKEQTCDVEQAVMEDKCTDAETNGSSPNAGPALTEAPAQQSGEDAGDTVPENSSTPPSSKAIRRRPFQRIKPKPNIPQISKHQATKEASLPSNLESTSKTTSEVQPQSTLHADQTGPSPTVEVSSTLPSAGEATSSNVEKTTEPADQVRSEPQPTDAEKIQCAPNNITEAPAQQSNASLLQEGGDHGVMPEVNQCHNSSTRPSSQPTRKTRFPRVKPKPNLPQISKSGRSTHQTTKETLLSANQESSSKRAAKVESFSTDKPSQRTSAVTPSVGCSTSMIPSEEAPSPRQEAEADQGFPTQDSGKENQRIKSLCFNPERTLISSNNEVPSACGPHAEQAASHQGGKLREKSSNSALKPDSSSHSSVEAPSPALPLEPTPEHPSSSGDNKKEVSSEESKYTPETTQRRQHLPKVKPYLTSPARAIRCVSQSGDGGELSKQTLSYLHISSQHQLVEERSEPQSGNNEEVATACKERPNDTAPCQDKAEGGTSLESDGHVIPALPSNVQPGEDIVNMPSLRCLDDPTLPKTSTTTRRPKPSPSTSPPRPQEVADAGLTALTRAPVPLHTPDPVVPAEGAVEDQPTLTTAQNQTPAGLSIFRDTLSVPSDPDEPFFILSLTEIPVVCAGEVPAAAPQPPPPLPEAHASGQQSLAVDTVAAGQVSSTADLLPSNDETCTTTGPAVEDPVAFPEEQQTQACTSAAPWRAASSPKRKPKGFLSFLSGTGSATQSESTRLKPASRRPTVKALQRQRPPRHNNTSTITQAPVDTSLPDPVDTRLPEAAEPEAPVETSLPDPVDTRLPEAAVESRLPKPEAAEPEAPVDTRMPQPEAPVDTRIPQPEAPVDTRIPQPEAPVDTRIPQPEAPVDTRIPQPEAAVETRIPEPEAPVDTRLPEMHAAPRGAEVSVCEEHSSTAVQEEPTDVSQYFLRDIFTDIQDT
uniref:transcription factor TFIIIB component B'' homolog isoform X2 n=1 Tax=Doryrhamphus excisus TaxID=161450 RepID=UPI0025AE8C8E|nr:transcription factor TFIIIB component B'' homolog isoform X2 [Doryrhamphus excisus]